VGLLAAVALALVRIGTSPKVFAAPLPIAGATGHVQEWLGVPTTELLAVTRADVEQALVWRREIATSGGLSTDAQIAAVAKRCHAEVHTADTDFARFPGTRWRNPLR
jgi:predicted nucleic acid-binding protein